MGIPKLMINSIRFTDDMVILADDSKPVKMKIVNQEEGNIKYGIKIKVGKAKVMRINKNEARKNTICKVQKLRSTLTKDERCEIDIMRT